MNLLRFLNPIFIFLGVFVFSTTLFSENKDKKISTEPPAFKHSDQNAFIENKGQIFDQNHKPNPACLYLYASDSMNLQLRKTGFSYDLYTITDFAKQKPGEKPLPENFLIKFHRIDVEIVGINSNVEIEAIEPCNDYFNYYNIDNPVKNVKQYMKVLYRNAYKNIDIEFIAGEKGKIKYNFIVHPGGKTDDIKLKFDGGEDSFATNLLNNSIDIQTSLGKLNESIPESWLEDEGKKVFVSYKLVGENTFGFRLNEPYSCESTLIIDPLTTRSWATYYGGSLDDGGIHGSRMVHDMTLDTSGSIYFAASTSSTNQIASTGAFKGSLEGSFDAFVVKFNCDGTRAWGTYYGGPDNDYGHNVSNDGSFLYVIGTTGSTSNISTAGSFQPVFGGGTEDLFLIKFDFNGNRIWGTYYGGSLWDYGADITVSATGGIYISGGTNSTDGISTTGSHQPTPGGGWDAFIAKFTATGTRVWGTYYGGGSTEAWWTTKVTTDNIGNVYLASDVWGGNPAIASPGAHQTVYGGGNSDAFLVKFNTNGTRIWGTYYGGSGDETYNSNEPFGIKADASQNVYFYGTTTSTDNISTPGSYQPALSGGKDAFLVKLDNSGTCQWSTYYGGTLDESGLGMTVDFSGGIYICGLTSSTAGITTAAAYNASYNGGVSDGFFAKFSNNGLLQYGSYYGGSDEDRINCIVTDGITQLYLFGETNSPANIATPGSFQPVYGGGNTDAFLVKFLDIDIIQIQGPGSVCKDSAYTYSTVLPVLPSITYNWIFPPGTTITSGQGTNTANVTWGANYGPVIVQVTYPGACAPINDTLDVIKSCACVTSLLLTSVQTNDSCNGGSFGIATVSASAGNSPYTCIWSPTPGGGQTTQTATGLNAGAYSIKVTDADGCKDSTTVLINIHPLVIVTTRSDTTICKGNSITLTASGTVNYSWFPGTGLNTSTGSVVIATPLVTTNYYVIGTDANNCTGKDSVTITVSPFPDVMPIGDTLICSGDSTTLTASGGGMYLWLPGNIPDSIITVSPTTSANYTVIVTNAGGCKDSSSIHVNVNPLPQALFNLNPVCKNDPVIYTDASVGNILDWNWNYGDGTTSILQNSSHVYATCDTFSVKLAITTTAGCKDSITKTARVYCLPIADFSFTEGCLNQVTNFTDLSTFSGGTITAWLWDYGDGSLQNTIQNPSHTYLVAGSYIVTLIATTNNGCTDTVTKNMKVHPLPDVQFRTGNVCDGNIVQFMDLSSVASPDISQSWSWDFGDGSALNNTPNTAHLYTGAGSYTVQLLIVSSFGCKDSLSKVVVVNPNPVVNFAATDTTGCEPLCDNFQNTSTIATGTIVQWLWNFGIGSAASIVQNPQNCFTNDSVFSPISYSISLMATSDSGCVSTLIKNNFITVYPNPIASFTVQPETASINIPVISTTDLSVGANFWNWNFGGSTLLTIGADTSHLENPLPYTYADTGTYTIRLITSTQYGCSDTAYQTITIEPEFLFYIPNAFTPNNDGINDSFSPKGIFFKEFDMSIFDRWGNIIYKTNDINQPWDGKANHGTEIAQRDVYLYVITLTDIKKKNHTYKGAVTLVR